MAAPCTALVLLLAASAAAWVSDAPPKRIFKLGDVPSKQFLGNTTDSDFFRLLMKDDKYIIIGARNTLYNLSASDLTENLDQRIEWHSTQPSRELCSLKGKSLEIDCQNYLRVASPTVDGNLIVCGTNSYKPLCREYHPRMHGHPRKHREFEGIGICPYDPEHNSTAITVGGDLYTATVSDFSGTDPLIYRIPQHTERSDLRQLNNPSFVSSVASEDYALFFYRETAVEYMNCGKAVYSRVAKVCLNDMGGPHPYRDKWTSFSKARLNCSVPGDYPFYFDEIQSTTDIINDDYTDANRQPALIYGVFTTPVNSIGGSAVCAFAMSDILKALNGDFKDQESLNSNWLPVDDKRIPSPKPGGCVKDSRTLPETTLNFIRTHSLMELPVSSYYAKPLLVRVSLQYRLTAIQVVPHVAALDGIRYDVLYVGTDDGRIIKTLNVAHNPVIYDDDDEVIENPNHPVETVVVSETQILPFGVAVRQLHISQASEKLIILSNEIIKTMPLHHCTTIGSCRDCVSLQDPNCAWDSTKQQCILVREGDADRFRNLGMLQDVQKGSSDRCNKIPIQSKDDSPARPSSHGTVSGTAKHPVHIDFERNNVVDVDNEIVIELVKSNEIPDIASDAKQKHEQDSLTVNRADNMIYTAQALHIAVVASCLVTLLLGFVVGYLFSRRFRHPFLSDTTPFHEQHNHLNRLTPLETPLNANSSAYLQPRANKTINMVVNVPAKQDNLQHELGSKDRTHECKNSNESLDKDIKCGGTLQKVKKTYI